MWFDVYTNMQMITYYNVKPKWHKCGLNPQMWISMGKYHNYICKTDNKLVFYNLSSSTVILSSYEKVVTSYHNKTGLHNTQQGTLNNLPTTRTGHLSYPTP